MNKKETKEIQELLFALLPLWNYKITKPFKQSLETGISMEMYYCLQILIFNKGIMNMSEISKKMNMSKQQATKLIDKMVEHKLVNRIYDDTDRRVIKVQETEHSKQYIDYFLNEKMDCFDSLLLEMSQEDRDIFKRALQDLLNVFIKNSLKEHK